MRSSILVSSILLGLSALLACGRTGEQTTSATGMVGTASTAQMNAPSQMNVPTQASAAPDDDCAAIFAPPPGAEKLCDEHVRGAREEIHFTSWGTAEDIEAVNVRYRAPASKCGLGVVTKPPLFSLTKGDLHLSTHDAADSHYPKCSVAPKHEHKTVVVISSKTDFSR